MEEVSETSRLRKILSTNPTSPSYLIRPDGAWTTSSAESLELLIETHFPGSFDDSMEPGAHRGTPSLIDTEGIVDRERILWALNGFKPYKSAGPDRIIPAEIQRNSAVILPWLEAIFRGCLELVYIPRKWTEVRVVFIPKSGKSSHAYPKDLRPLTLSSFLLKTLERLIDVVIRSKIEPRNWAMSQHAYCKGKSVDTALHELVRMIEKSIYTQEFCMVTFLDIEGAFNNVKTEAIMDGLSFLNVDYPTRRLINQMLVSRIITSELGESTIRRRVVRGTPQGGVMSPFLWSVVMNELLLELEREGTGVVAYADDVAIAVSGKYLDTIRDVMQNALRIVAKWASKCGLGINPSKTELVLFTKKYKIPEVSPPTVNGIRLAFADRARFLGIILDSKLSWKPNIVERVNKANVAIYSCRNAIGKRWGLKPELVHWLYTAVVRPVLIYGVGVWWPALDKITYVRMMEKVQRTACMLISGALRTTPTRALEVMFHLIPIDFFGKQMAANVATRLSAVSQWKCLQVGHSTIVRSLSEELANLDYIKPTLCFDKCFRTICPSRESWRNGSILENEALQFFTDGSKLDGKVGAGVFCEKLNVNISVRLPDYCSVYQAEVAAIWQVVTWLKHNVVSVRDIAIYVDSQAAVRSLEAVCLRSRVALDCRSSLNEMSEYFSIQIIWVPGHSDVMGNCRADELARYGTTLQIQPEGAGLGRPIAALKLALSKKAIALTNERWTNTLTCRVAKQVWPKLDLRRSKALISLGKRDVGLVVGILTGHCLFGEHARRLGLQTNDFCRSCMDEEEEETLDHFLCSCPALSYKRHRYLGVYGMENLAELAGCGVRDILRYISSSGWFQRE
jgi:ribonuclease HI